MESYADTIDAANAPLEKTGIYRNFLEAIRRAENYSDICTDRLDREKTYLFELVGSQIQVVVCYDTPMLYHIGTRNNVTGIEADEDIGIVKE